MNVWYHNFKEWIKSHRLYYEPIYLIRCWKCKHIQRESNGWDYQRCEKCEEYMYDVR